MEIDYKVDWYKTKDYKTFEETLPEYWQMKYEDRFCVLSDFCTVGSVLDVGCGTGRALSHFKRLGAEVLGIDPSDYSVNNSRLFEEEIIQGDFMDVQLDKTFDVVYFEQVLSHMPKAMDAIAKARELMNEDGIMVIEEPNDYNPLQMQIELQEGLYWVTNDHCNYFNFNSLENKLKSKGLEVVYKSCTYPMELFYMQGFNYIGDEEVGRRVHKMRYNMLSQMTYTQRKELKESFAKMGWGRDLFLICKKGVLPNG